MQVVSSHTTPHPVQMRRFRLGKIVRGAFKSNVPTTDHSTETTIVHSHGTPLLPAELWILIIDCCDRETIQRLTLTCKSLNSLSLAQLTRNLQLNFVNGNGGKNVSITKRLQDYMSYPEKAHPVDDLAILFTRAPVFTSAPVEPIINLGAELRWVFESLPCFVNLRSLTLIRPPLDPSSWTTIRELINRTELGLPRLNSLTIRYFSGVWPGHMDPPFHVARLTIDHILIGEWASMLSPAHLTHLSVGCMDRVQAIDLPRMPHLRFLRVLVNFGSKLQCAPFLTEYKCPNLETFEMGPLSHFIETHLPAPECSGIFLPKLRSYRGPDTYASTFAAGGNLVHVSLWNGQISSRATSHSREDELPDQLKIMGALSPEVKSLRLSDTRMSRNLFNAIGNLICLEDIDIDLRETDLGDMTRQDFIEALSKSQFPPCLKQLRIQSRLPSEDASKMLAEHLDRLDNWQMEKFCRNYPKLRYASLSAKDFHWNSYGLLR